jgi:hypothetical protein
VVTRRVVRLVLCAAAVALLPLPAAGQEPPAPPPAPEIELVSRPAWAQPTDDLRFAVRTTGDPVTTTVQVEVFSSLDSLAQLERSSTEDVGVRLSRLLTPVAELPPGPDGTLLVSLPVAPEAVDGLTTQLVEPAVHPVVISLLDEAGTEVDQVRTPLVRLADDGEPWGAPDLAVLLDVAAPPSLQPDGSRVLSGAVVDRLAEVGAVLDAHPDLDLTVAAVPDTLDALATRPDGATGVLLDRLTGREVLAAPYVRLPVDAMVEHRLEGLIEPLVGRGAAQLADGVGRAPRRTVWDGEAPVGDAGGRILAELGYEHVVVRAAAGPDDEPARLADAGPRPVRGAGSLLALVADPELSDRLAEPAPDRVDAAHLALAQYLLHPVEDLELDDDDTDRAPVVLVRPGLLAPGSTLAALLRLLDAPDAPVQVGGLGLVERRPPASGAAPVRAEGPDVDLAATAPRVLALAGRLASFAGMLGDRSPRGDDLRLQVATAVAEATAPADRAAAVQAVEDAIDEAFAAIRLSGQTDLNLTSRQGTLPVTIENGNPFTVDLVVRVRSDRLAFPEGDALDITVADGESRRIDLPVEARATGSVPVFVELWTSDDRTQLDARQLNVRSTAVSGVGLVISAGALVVLLSWWVRHSRRIRREAASGTGDAPMG